MVKKIKPDASKTIYVGGILAKLGVASRTEAVTLTLRNHILS